jgi:hypothetical protein
MPRSEAVYYEAIGSVLAFGIGVHCFYALQVLAGMFNTPASLRTLVGGVGLLPGVRPGRPKYSRDTMWAFQN